MRYTLQKGILKKILCPGRSPTVCTPQVKQVHTFDMAHNEEAEDAPTTFQHELEDLWSDAMVATMFKTTVDERKRETSKVSYKITCRNQ